MKYYDGQYAKHCEGRRKMYNAKNEKYLKSLYRQRKQLRERIKKYDEINEPVNELKKRLEHIEELIQLGEDRL